MNVDTPAADWRKSSRSNTEGNQCVEVAVTPRAAGNWASRELDERQSDRG
ncbi:DUF397 domain-containing protein [Actinoallomurus sp. NBC_01490]|nr:DUF397 domain-containing protein [Actinoallomurus sp. NBC_01490]